MDFFLTDNDNLQNSRGREGPIVIPLYFTRSRTFRHLFAVLHLRCASLLLKVLIWEINSRSQESKLSTDLD